MMGGFGLGMLVWVAVVVAVVWALVQAAAQRQQPQTPAAPSATTPRGLLDARLARGEISVEEYRELRKAIE